MKLTIRDGIATVFVAAVLVPYVGYLVRGDMPFIKDPRGMAATALILGIAAFFTAGRDFTASTVGRAELDAGIGIAVLGFVTLALAGTAAAEVLLAVFVAAIVLVWAVQMLHHAGLFENRSSRTALPQ